MAVRTFEGSLESKKIKLVNLKENQPWTLFERTDAKAPILWLPDENNRLTGRPWCWERLKAEEEGDRRWDVWMASLTWWTWMNLGKLWETQKPAVGSPWGHEESDMTWQLNSNNGCQRGCQERWSGRRNYQQKLFPGRGTSKGANPRGLFIVTQQRDGVRDISWAGGKGISQISQRSRD